MKNVEILGVEIHFEIKVTNEIRNSIDLGSLTLKKDGRSYILDTVQSWIDSNGYMIECKVMEDRELFSDCKYDLTEVDLMLGDLDEATFFIGDEYIEEPTHMTLLVKSGGMTKAIELTID